MFGVCILVAGATGALGTRHAETTTYWVMTGMSLPVYSGGPALDRQRMLRRQP